MKTKHLLAPLAICCAVTALVGCVSTDRQIYESSLDGMNLQRDEALSPTGLSQPVILDESAARKLDLANTGAVTLNAWQHSDTNAAAKENFSTLDENDDGQINATESLTLAPKHSKLYSVFGDAEQTNRNHSSWDRQEFQPQGLQLFSIRF
jgi:hypothetical protein